jgi:hypothetical protein
MSDLQLHAYGPAWAVTEGPSSSPSPSARRTPRASSSTLKPIPKTAGATWRPHLSRPASSPASGSMQTRAWSEGTKVQCTLFVSSHTFSILGFIH